MSVQTKKRKNRTKYYVVTLHNGKHYWEPAGHDKREAERLDARREKEKVAGTYQPPLARFSGSVGGWLVRWLETRTNRTANNDRRLLTNHVIEQADRKWFTKMDIDDVAPKECIQLVKELQKTHLAPKSVTYVASLMRTAFRDAEIEEVVLRSPWVITKGILSRKVKNKRVHYPLADVHKVLTCDAIDSDLRVWIWLAFFTGMREGEICGRRWRHWDRECEPLTCLTVDTQYDDQPLKSDDDDKVRPRNVPVHPALEAMLTWWWSEGFEQVFCRKPTPDDFIVPNRRGGNHTKSSGYKAWRRSLRRAEVVNRTLHSTRHSFITHARRHGAQKDVLEKVTHNAEGEIIDHYTHWEWAPLCEQVACFPAPPEPESVAPEGESERGSSGSDEAGSVSADVSAFQKHPKNIDKNSSSAWTRIADNLRNSAEYGVRDPISGATDPSNNATFLQLAAVLSARQRALEEVLEAYETRSPGAFAKWLSEELQACLENTPHTSPEIASG